MTDNNTFRPYKIIHQSGSSLELKAGTNPKVIRAAFLAGPAILFTAGIALFATQKQPLPLYIMCGVAVLELFAFSFIKMPADLRMDSVGFTLKTVSIKSSQDTDYLWNDVDHIRQRIIRSKNGATLAYDVIMKEGKKMRLLNFSNYNAKKQSATEINSILSQISKKPVTEK
jgi:hypothetical protein